MLCAFYTTLMAFTVLLHTVRFLAPASLIMHPLIALSYYHTFSLFTIFGWNASSLLSFVSFTAFILSSLCASMFLQLWHEQPSQSIPLEKQSQYNLRQCDFLQLQQIFLLLSFSFGFWRIIGHMFAPRELSLRMWDSFFLMNARLSIHEISCLN